MKIKFIYIGLLGYMGICLLNFAIPLRTLEVLSIISQTVLLFVIISEAEYLEFKIGFYKNHQL